MKDTQLGHEQPQGRAAAANARIDQQLRRLILCCSDTSSPRAGPRTDPPHPAPTLLDRPPRSLAARTPAGARASRGVATPGKADKKKISKASLSPPPLPPSPNTDKNVQIKPGGGDATCPANQRHVAGAPRRGSHRNKRPACCGLLRLVAACCGLLRFVAALRHVAFCCALLRLLRFVAICCDLLRRVAACCGANDAHP